MVEEKADEVQVQGGVDKQACVQEGLRGRQVRRNARGAETSGLGESQRGAGLAAAPLRVPAGPPRPAHSEA